MESLASRDLVSVIIPCYNYANFLPDCIQSVLNSSYQEIEIIIVDDGSQDNSIAIANKFAADYPFIQVIQQQNGGPSKARNAGISQATGSYILALDADDKIAFNYLEEAVSILSSRPEVKVVYAEAEKFGLKNEPWNLKDFSIANLAKDNMIYVSAIYRKEDWSRVGGYTENPVCVREDWEFWIKMLKDGGEVVKLPFVGFYYRIHTISRRKSMTTDKKNAEIAYLNQQHKAFFYRYLNGPLRSMRSYSKLYNTLLNLIGLLPKI